MHFCGCQNKDDIGRRFLQCFQKRIERSDGKHMNLVNNINLVFPFCRRIIHLFDNLPDTVHAIVGCRINLDYIHAGSCCNGSADRTFPTRTAIHRMLTIDRFRKDLGNCGLTGSTGSAEQIGMRSPPASDLVL